MDNREDGRVAYRNSVDGREPARAHNRQRASLEQYFKEQVHEVTRLGRCLGRNQVSGLHVQIRIILTEHPGVSKEA